MNFKLNPYKETTGGRCVYKAFRGNVYGSYYTKFEKWYEKEAEKQITRKKFGNLFGWKKEIHFPKLRVENNDQYSLNIGLNNLI